LLLHYVKLKTPSIENGTGVFFTTREGTRADVVGAIDITGNFYFSHTDRIDLSYVALQSR